MMVAAAPQLHAWQNRDRLPNGQLPSQHYGACFDHRSCGDGVTTRPGSCLPEPSEKSNVLRHSMPWPPPAGPDPSRARFPVLGIDLVPGSIRRRKLIPPRKLFLTERYSKQCYVKGWRIACAAAQAACCKGALALSGAPYRKQAVVMPAMEATRPPASLARAWSIAKKERFCATSVCCRQKLRRRHSGNEFVARRW